MDDTVFKETGKITKKIHKNRNLQINVAALVMIQADLVNKDHPFTIIGPITANGKPDSEILRVHTSQED